MFEQLKSLWTQAVDKNACYMLCFMSGPTAEHNNGRLNTIGYPIGHKGPTPSATHDHGRVIYRPFPRAFWNFMELHV